MQTRSGLIRLGRLSEMREGLVPALISARWFSTCKDKDQMLFSTQIQFDSNRGKNIANRISLEAVYQDWKFVTPRLQAAGVRLIGVNYPGFGITEDHPELTHENVERNAFVEALMAALGLKENLVFMGHCRGSENALELSARNSNKTVGTVMVSSPGMRRHRGISRASVIEFVTNTYDRYPVTRSIMQYTMQQFYTRALGLRTSSGREVMNCVKVMGNLSFHGKRPHVQFINENEHIRVLHVYGGHDVFIEPEISREFASEFNNPAHLVCETTDADDEAAVLTAMKQSFVEYGKQTVSCEFVPDGHFLQKSRAGFVAEGIVAMLQATSRDETV